MEKMLKKLYTIAKHYGEPKQKVQAIEEMAELTKAIVKGYQKQNRENYIEELADTYIMISQLMILMTKEDKNLFEQIVCEKIKRQLKRIEQEKRV